MKRFYFFPYFFTYARYFSLYSALRACIYNYIWPLIIIWFLSYKTPLVFSETIILYIVSFTIFLVFYELGYLWNDAVALSEKKWSIRNSEYIIYNWQILVISRVFIVVLWIFALRILYGNYVNYFLLLLFFCGGIFSLHNLIRNFLINFGTTIFLKLSKLGVFYSCLYFMSASNLEIIIFFSFVDLVSENYLLTKKYLQKIMPHPNDVILNLCVDLPWFFFYFLMFTLSIFLYFYTENALYFLYFSYYLLRTFVQSKKLKNFNFYRR